MGAYTLLQDLTVTTNSTSVVLNNFGTITKDDFVKVEFTFANNSNDATQYRLFPTSNTTNSNYTRQVLFGSGSSVSAGRTNDNIIGNCALNETNSITSFVKLSQNDKFNVFSNTNFASTSSLQNAFFYVTQNTGTTTSITSFTVSARDTNGIGTGSRIQIYKLAATKVADFTVASNSTQVDIPFPTGTFSPAIDKDSEYLLVGNYIRNTGDLLFGVNDNTTSTTYHSQQIRGNGSTASASRRNEPRIVDAGGTNINLFYCHIKLSNIGAFTAQTYVIKNSNTTAPIVDNFFISSTAENITSITKLNLYSNATSGIATGSRFELYKLYE